jgi:hypothetical protein
VAVINTPFKFQSFASVEFHTLTHSQLEIIALLVIAALAYQEAGALLNDLFSR